MRLSAISVIVFLGLFSCDQGKIEPVVFELRKPEETGIDFFNAVEHNPKFNIFSYRNFYNGGGVALGDVNNDGLTDVYLTANMGPNKLFLNKGDFRFEDVTEKAGVAGNRGWSTGVVMVDINNDGLLDIYVCNAGFVEGDDRANELFLNQGDMTFLEAAADYGLNEQGYTTHAAFFDYDRDGDLDAYILNNSFIPVNTLNYSNKRELRAKDWPVRDFLKGGGDKLLRNEHGRFVDVSESAGIYGSLIGFGLGITVGDVNGDQWPDFYVSNDFFERDYLYINRQDGTFSEEIKEYMPHLSLSSMGADMADLNNDGYPEIFVTEMLPERDDRRKQTTTFENYNTYLLKQQRDFYHQFMQNTLQFNNQDGTFSDIAYYSGVAASDWSWGALLFDVNNDGLRDIFVCNGVFQDVTDQDFIDFFANDVVQKMVLTGEKEEMEKVVAAMPSNPQLNKLFINEGEMRFADKGANWGIDQPSFSNGAAYADLDNDGDLDLVVNNLNMESFVFENKSNELFGHHYIAIDLQGPPQNTRAIGAEIRCFVGGEVLYSELIPTRGFQSSIGYRQHFGLGEDDRIDSLQVRWPDGTRTRLMDIPSDTLLSIAYPSPELESPPALPYPQSSSSPGYLQEIPSGLAAHKEDDFFDFFQEGLTIRMLSREGPALAVADANGDGREDVFIGGAAGSPGHLYLQQEGELVEKKDAGFQEMADYEDTDAHFFDADGDGDMDLFVGSGGNHVRPRDPLMQDRLLINDGTGRFTHSPGAFPNNGFNTAKSLSMDLNEDGFMDLIVVSRSVPGIYGLPPRSYVFANKGDGTFEDQTEELAPELILPGMLTDVIAADVMGDGEPEIILVGEWSAPQILMRENGKFARQKTSLDEYTGWWYSVAAADLDGDGDLDLALGNLGENFYFSASQQAPAKLWVADFDNNKTFEKIITQSIDGRDMPVAMKREITAQLTFLKKQNLKHADYSQRSIQDLFSPEQLNDTRVNTATYFSSAIAYNMGNGQFRLEALPKEVQFSCVCDIYCTDLNGDGRPDLVMGGNEYGFLPQFSRLDASYGHTLINDGEGGFEWVKNRNSGFFVKGEVRNIRTVHLADGDYLLVGVNNAKPKLFKLLDEKKEQDEHF